MHVDVVLSATTGLGDAGSVIGKIPYSAPHQVSEPPFIEGSAGYESGGTHDVWWARRWWSWPHSRMFSTSSSCWECRSPMSQEVAGLWGSSHVKCSSRADTDVPREEIQLA